MGGTNLSVGTRLPMGGEGGNYLLTFIPDTEELLHWKHMKTLFNNSICVTTGERCIFKE